MNQWFVGGSSTRSVNGSTRVCTVRRVVAAGCVAVVAGCSMVGRLGYDNLPRLATWRADSYLSLTADQRAAATRRFEALHDWHRTTQLDDYIALLREVQRHVAAGDVDEARIRQSRMQAFERWRPIAEHAAPGVVEVVATLSPAQLQHLREAMERDNDKLRKTWMPADRGERVESRSRRYVERAETFLGSLTAEQKQYARRLAAQVPDSEDAWFRQRVARQQDLVALMERIRRERPDEATATRWMREHLVPEQVRVRVDIFNAAAAMLRTGIGVAVLPTFMEERLPELVAVSEVIPALDVPLWMLTHPDLRGTARVKAFMRFVGDAVAERLAAQA